MASLISHLSTAFCGSLSSGPLLSGLSVYMLTSLCLQLTSLRLPNVFSRRLVADGHVQVDGCECYSFVQLARVQ